MTKYHWLHIFVQTSLNVACKQIFLKNRSYPWISRIVRSAAVKSECEDREFCKASRNKGILFFLSRPTRASRCHCRVPTISGHKAVVGLAAKLTWDFMKRTCTEFPCLYIRCITLLAYKFLSCTRDSNSHRRQVLLHFGKAFVFARCARQCQSALSDVSR